MYVALSKSKLSVGVMDSSSSSLSLSSPCHPKMLLPPFLEEAQTGANEVSGSKVWILLKSIRVWQMISLYQAVKVEGCTL